MGLRRFPDRSSKDGFTFIEVMIALSIISVLLVTLLYTTNHNLTIAGRHEALTVATMLAHKKLADIRYDSTRELRNKKGNFDEPYEDYTFELKKEEKSVFLILGYVDSSVITIKVHGRGETVSLKKSLPKKIKQVSE